MTRTRRTRPAAPGRLALALAALLAAPLAGCDNPFGSDDSRPEVILSSPAAATLDADSVVVEGAARDDRVVQRLAYRLNGGPEVSVQVQPGKIVTFRFVVRELKLGANELEVVAYDDAERLGAQKVSLSTRDVAAPAVQVRTPADNELVHRDSVRVEGVAADERRVVALTYALDGGAEQPVTFTPGKEAAFALTLKETAPGEHTLVLRARDEAGNTGTQTLRFTTSAARVTINFPRPDSTVTAFAVWMSGRFDSPVPVASFTYSVNGGPEVRVVRSMSTLFPVEGTPDRYSFSGVVDSLPQGRSTVRVFAYDAQGRRVGVGTLPFTVSVPVRQYALTFLGALPGAAPGVALNEKGQAVGTWSDDARRAHGWVWDGTRLVDLRAATGWTESAPTGINESGVVVGTFREAADACTRSFRYRIGVDAAPRRLLDDCDHLARDVNDAGRVLVSHSAGGTVEGYLLDGEQRHRLLPARDAYTQAFWRLNNRDEALGALTHGFWGLVPALFTTTAEPVQAGVCIPVDLNDAGDVAYGGVCKSVQLGSNGSVAGKPLVNLGVPTPYSRVSADGMNNRNEAVGMYTLSARPDAAGNAVTTVRPFFWDGARSHDVQLSDADWRVDGVADLNDAGVILAHATNTRTGQRGPVLLTPRG